MEKQNSHRLSNLWFGFILGSGLTAVFAYFLGTKSGRKSLKKILELSENLEENLILIGEELEDNLINKKDNIIEELKEFTNPENETKHHTLDNILSKIKSLAPDKEKTKKFFIKENKNST